MKSSNAVVLRPGTWPAFVASLLMVSGLLVACDAMNPVENVTFENPIDPGADPGIFVVPDTRITGGPGNDDTVYSNEVTFTWDANEDERAMLFQVRITGVGWPDTWSDWDGERSLFLGNLDETDYTFEVRSGLDPGSGDPKHQDDTPASVSFNVDAMQGPALRMTPTYQVQDINNTFSVDIVAEDISDLTMAQIRIIFNSNLLQYDNYTYGSFLSSNGGDPLGWPNPEVDQNAGFVEISFGITKLIAGASSPGVSGTGVILTVHFRAINSGAANIDFRFADTLLRNYLNDPILISTSDLRGALVIIR